MPEIVDRVDENDKVIGQVDLYKRHDLLHRGTTIIVFKDSTKREMLIQRRSWRKRAAPNLLCFTGGHVDSGESYLEAAKRELQEEMFHGHKLPELRFTEISKIKKTADNDPEFMTTFTTVYPGPFFIDPMEVDSWFFEKIDVLKERIEQHPQEFTGTCRVVFKELMGKV